jgi:predicted acylesterase/phospholipase RssA
VLVRGVAAAQVLAERRQQHQEGQGAAAVRLSLAVPGGRAQLDAGS